MDDDLETESLLQELAACRERNKIDREKIKNILCNYSSDAEYQKATAASNLFDCVEMLCAMVAKDGAQWLHTPEGQMVLRKTAFAYRENMNFVDDEKAAGTDFERDMVNLIEMIE